MDQSAQPRAIDTLLAAYRKRHLNRTNEIIHFVCVPVIVLSLLGLAWSVHPVAALAGAALALRYYLTLSRPFAIAMLLMSAAMLAVLAALPPATVLPLSIAMLALAWIGQFIGHQIEGKQAALFDDPRLMLIGPLFVLSFLLRRLNVAY